MQPQRAAGVGAHRVRVAGRRDGAVGQGVVLQGREEGDQAVRGVQLRQALPQVGLEAGTELGRLAALLALGLAPADVVLRR